MNVLDVQCPYCGSLPGFECVTAGGRNTQPHAARRKAMEAVLARVAAVKLRKARKARVARGRIVQWLQRGLDGLAYTGSEWNTHCIERWVVKYGKA